MNLPPLTGYRKAELWSQVHLCAGRVERAAYRQSVTNVERHIKELQEYLKIIKDNKEFIPVNLAANVGKEITVLFVSSEGSWRADLQKWVDEHAGKEVTGIVEQQGESFYFRPHGIKELVLNDEEISGLPR